MHTDLDVKSLSDEELTQEVFSSISGKKAHITMKDLLGWDLVHLMLAEVSDVHRSVV